MFMGYEEIKLTPGYEGKNCLGNGEHYDLYGNLIECCCDECDYAMVCFENICENLQK